MGDEPKFREKWDFRRKEHSFDDSSSDDPDSNSTHDPIIHNSNLVLDSNQLDNGTPPVTREQPVKTRKRWSKKDESKPEKAKQLRGRKPKTVCVEENKKKKEEMVMETNGVGMFMKTLLDDLTASRESLMDWMKTELYGSSNQNVASRPTLIKKRAVSAQRSMKKRRTKKEEEEEKESEKQSKPNENGQEMNEPKEKSPEIAQNGGGQVQELDCNTGPLNMFLKSGQGSLGRNYFHQQQEGQIEMENPKKETEKSQKSIVLAIEAQNLSQRRKKTREAYTNKNRSLMVEITGSETQKDDNFVIPFAPNPFSTSMLQSFPVGSSLNSLFSFSNQGITSSASNSNYQLRQPVAQIPDNSEFPRGVTGGQGFGDSLFPNNGYFSGFPSALQPNLIPGGYNFPVQVNPANSSHQRDNNNMFGGLRMAGGAIRIPGNRFPEVEVANGDNSLSDYRTSSGR